MKKTFSILFALLLMSVTFASCGSEEEVSANFPTELLGMWEGVSVEDDTPAIKPGEDVADVVAPATGISDTRLLFDLSGVVVVLNRTLPGIDEWKEVNRGAWLYSATGKLLLSFKKDEIITCTIAKLDYANMEFSLSQSETDEDGQTTSKTYTCTFRRVVAVF